jgi:D-amino peptidase
MTDIEGVTGVTTFPQAESSAFGRDMLMHDLLAVIDGIRSAGRHEIVLYDMHTDGRNIDLSSLDDSISVVVGKPLSRQKWKSLDGPFDGLFLLGLHAMAETPGALMAHTYLREYKAIYINGKRVGEVAIEAALAAEQAVPLLFVSGDSCGCAEAVSQFPDIQAVIVKDSLGDAEALCYPPAQTRQRLFAGAKAAAALTEKTACQAPNQPVTIAIDFSQCHYIEVLRRLHPEILVSQYRAELTGPTLFACWTRYLEYEREMIKG